MDTPRDRSDIPWPSPGPTAFAPSSNRSTAAYVKWFGMGTTEGYAEGFKMAIERIVSTLAASGHYGHPDRLFYPVAFLARHYFELMLKHLIIKASTLLAQPTAVAGLSKTHSIESLWKRLRPMLESLWPAGPSADLDAVERVLLEFHGLDPTGVTFRYDSDKSGTSHSGGLPDVVDLEVLWHAVRDSGALLEGCSAAIEEWMENREP